MWDVLEVDSSESIANFDPQKSFTVKVDSTADGRTNVWVSQEEECGTCNLVTVLSCVAALVLLVATALVLIYVYRQLWQIREQRSAAMHINMASAEAEEHQAQQARLGRLQRSQSWSPQEHISPLVSGSARSHCIAEREPGTKSAGGSCKDMAAC